MALFCWHKWTKWAPYSDIVKDGHKVGEIDYRICKKCGKRQTYKFW